MENNKMKYLILLSLLIPIISGCNEESSMVEKAKNACKCNGGVASAVWDNDNYDILCKGGLHMAGKIKDVGFYCE
jgi:hypothetical protein